MKRMVLILLALFGSCGEIFYPVAWASPTPTPTQQPVVVATPTRVPCASVSYWDPPFNGDLIEPVATVDGTSYYCARCCDCVEGQGLHCDMVPNGTWTDEQCCTNRYNP